ncbi:MAG: hypothetical protein ACK40O_02870 [Allosphingosinicella sp.]
MGTSGAGGLAGRLLCRLKRHVPEDRQVWNDGFYFSRCVNCRREILRRSGRWRPIPDGYRVVWKKRPEDYPDWKGVSRRIAEEQVRHGAETCRAGSG